MNNSFFKFFIGTLFFLLLCSSCITQKNIQYLQPRDGLTLDSFPVKTKDTYYYIQKGDILSIDIKSIVATQEVLNTELETKQPKSGNSELGGYPVNDQGNVTIPIVGDVYIEGLTLQQAGDTLKSKLKDYTKYVTVSVSLAKLRYTILGEVKSPGEILSNYTRLNLLEAVAKAGDFTNFSNRKNVKLIRKENNINRVYIIDFTSKDILLSDKLYIKPNDILIVDVKSGKLIKENLSTITLFTSLGTILGLAFLRIKNIL